MSRSLSILAALVALLFVSMPSTMAQLAGSRAGTESPSAAVPELPLLDRKTAESYIAIDGRAEVRVKATEIRIVLAVTGEGATAGACREAVEGVLAQLKAALSEIGVTEDRLVLDFISVLPRYEWRLQQQNGIDVGVEQNVGFRMQTNVHLAVPDEAKAQEVLAVAFAQNVTDIIAFDYWNDNLDAVKSQARRAAIDAAREKADVLLDAVFSERPQAINVQEDTTVRYPDSLYHSFTSDVAESVTGPFRHDIPFIRASRPRNTYYRGLYADADVQPSELAMRPEISVISTVRIYFESPSAQRAATDENDD
jgi:uncharacterized protein YggE